MQIRMLMFALCILVQTNSDGLLVVLGAAQVLNAIKDGGAVTRTKDSYNAVEE